jgi:hypothetical protein
MWKAKIVRCHVNCRPETIITGTSYLLVQSVEVFLAMMATSDRRNLYACDRSQDVHLCIIVDIHNMPAIK